MKTRLRFPWQTGEQVRLAMRLSRGASRIPLIGRTLSILIDKLLLNLYGVEATSTSIHGARRVVGPSAGVMLGGNGIRCTGTLNISSGVVFARRYGSDRADPEHFFDITEPGVCVGQPARRLDRAPSIDG